MYRRKTRLYSRHVGAAELAAYEEATAAYAELRELFESFVDEMTARTIREISQDAKKAKAGDSRDCEGVLHSSLFTIRWFDTPRV